MSTDPAPRRGPASALAAALLDLVLPLSCAGCETSGTAWCPRCRSAFGRSGWLEVPGCPPVLALARYAGTARATVLAYKERGRTDLARPLAGALATALAAHDLPGAAIVPAPSRRSAARARGGDHVLRLARALVAARPDPVLARALALGAGARDSVGLDPDQRAANLARHLRLRPRSVPVGRPVLLLDDVLTTGATARAASALLGAVGCPPLAVVVLTAVSARHGEPGRAPGGAGDPNGGRGPPPGHPFGGDGTS